MGGGSLVINVLRVPLPPRLKQLAPRLDILATRDGVLIDLRLVDGCVRLGHARQHLRTSPLLLNPMLVLHLLS